MKISKSLELHCRVGLLSFCPFVPLVLMWDRWDNGDILYMTHRHVSCSGAVRAILSHRVKQIYDIMKEPITLPEQRLLAAIIFSGFCANSRYAHAPDYHIPDAVKLLDKLLSAIDESNEVK